jgi:hypothetical protein
MAGSLTWAETIRRQTPTWESVGVKDDQELMRLLILANLATVAHLDRIASALERMEETSR